ncbi:MAG: DnaJ domain-containing protein [Gemmatimonadales bacterium]
MSEFYELLGVAKNASDDEIKKAYRKAAMQYHPDRNPAPDAEARFKEIAEAYEVLRDPDKRAAYDRFGKAGLGGAAGGPGGFHHVDLSEALNIFMRDFGGLGGFESLFGGGRPQAESRRGQDIRVTVKLTMRRGRHRGKAHRQAQDQPDLHDLQRHRRCQGNPAEPLCHLRRKRRGAPEHPERLRPVRLGGALSDLRWRGLGHHRTVRSLPGRGRTRGERSVRWRFRPASRATTTSRLRGQGAAGRRGGPNGDLLVMIEVKDDERFERHGDDLYFDLALSFSQAALGCSVTIPTPYGDEAVTVPPGVQAGTVLRLMGKGLPRLGQNASGDLNVRVGLWTPRTSPPNSGGCSRSSPRSRATRPAKAAGSGPNSRKPSAHELVARRGRSGGTRPGGPRPGHGGTHRPDVAGERRPGWLAMRQTSGRPARC